VKSPKLNGKEIIMLVKLLPRQIPEWQDIILDSMKHTLPASQAHASTEIIKDLLLDIAQGWVLYREGEYKAISITRIEETNELGGKMLTLLSVYAPKGLSGSGALLEGFETMKKFALANGCDRIAFYTDNPEVEKYLGLFPVLWKTHYYQLSLEV
jgi:hypothetical protein